MTDNAEERLTEAKQKAWLGEGAALQESLKHLRRRRKEAEHLQADDVELLRSHSYSFSDQLIDIRTVGLPVIVSVVDRGVADDANAFAVDNRTVWLRVSRTDHVFTYHASLDGKTWRMIRSFTLDTPPHPPPSASRPNLRPVTAAWSPSTTSTSPASACKNCATARDPGPDRRNSNSPEQEPVGCIGGARQLRGRVKELLDGRWCS